MKNQKHYDASSTSFWMDAQTFESFTNKKDLSLVDMIKLNAYRRSIANFVHIVTGKNVPVEFSSYDSYTDSKTVYITANSNPRYFDSNVGLALHEAAHIKLSSFSLLRPYALKNYLQKHRKWTTTDLDTWRNVYWRGHVERFKNIINVIEDRRIDSWMYKTAPGYKGYYDSLYSRYFYNKDIDKALLSNEYTDEDWDSYWFRLINLHNKNTRLDVLKGFKEISDLVDLKNIDRLKNTEDVREVAIAVMNTIYKYIDFDNTESEDSNDSNQQSDDASDSDGESPDENVTNPEGGSSNDNSNVNDKTVPELSEAQKKRVKSALNKQEKFLDGKTAKKRLSEKQRRDVDRVSKSGIGSEEVSFEDEYFGVRKTSVIVIEKLTKELIESNNFHFLDEWNIDKNKTAIQKGIKLGTILGRKLNLRTDSTATKYIRKRNGTIDKRLISELGFGNADIFQKTMIDSYTPSILYISVDGSSSMSSPWSKTMTSIVAMTKAASMIDNLDVVINFRFTSGSPTYPTILKAYDSRVDKFMKIRTLFKYINASGSTPEGLCFDRMLKDMVGSNNNLKSYFLNYSDGAPMFGNADVRYSGQKAYEHTAKMVKKIRDKNIKVISYFISGGMGYGDNHWKDIFKQMYGKDSYFINSENITEVARVMNKKFLER